MSSSNNSERIKDSIRFDSDSIAQTAGGLD